MTTYTRCYAAYLIALTTVAGCGSKSGSSTARPDRQTETQPVLIDADLVSETVIVTSRTGKVQDNLANIRQEVCEGREDDPVIFYQLVVSDEWHYYWLCSKSKPIRAATSGGAKKLGSWVKRMREQAVADSNRCGTDISKRLFKKIHASGVQAKAYCNGSMVLRFPDASKKSFSFPVTGGGETQTGTNNDGGGGQTAAGGCPTCPTCPPERCKNSYSRGVGAACRRICTLIYKKCRALRGGYGPVLRSE